MPTLKATLKARLMAHTEAVIEELLTQKRPPRRRRWRTSKASS